MKTIEVIDNFQVAENLREYRNGSTCWKIKKEWQKTELKTNGILIGHINNTFSGILCIR